MEPIMDVIDPFKPTPEKRCELTDIKVSWCAHCRRKTLTDEEQEAKDLDDMIARLARYGG
ncbi:MAG TPA: hypothetical protein VFK94_07405 [Patescibacteria group bacterium]|nr:hypothetical protein [Patescibacteria group bacterium]